VQAQDKFQKINKSKNFSKVCKLVSWMRKSTEQLLKKKKQKKKWATEFIQEHNNTKRNQEWKISKRWTQNKTCHFRLVNSHKEIHNLISREHKEQVKLDNSKTQMPCMTMLTSNVKLQMHKPKIIVYSLSSDEWKTRRVSLIWKKTQSDKTRVKLMAKMENRIHQMASHFIRHSLYLSLPSY